MHFWSLVVNTSAVMQKEGGLRDLLRLIEFCNSWISGLKMCYILMSSLRVYNFLNNLMLILFFIKLDFSKEWHRKS